MAEVYRWVPSSEEYRRKFFQVEGVSDENKRLVFEFVRRQEALGVGGRRRAKIYSSMKTMLSSLYPGLELKSAGEEELMELSRRIRESKYRPRTQEDFHVIVRRFYKVMEGRNSRYPEKLDFFKAPVGIPRTSKGPGDVISRPELDAMLGSCNNSRDKAALMLLYEGGLRVGELLSLDVRDVRLTDDGLEVHVPDKPECKTGPRDIWLVESYGRVRDWLECHPRRSDLKAPFLVALERHHRKRVYDRWDADSLRMMLKWKARKAGLSGERVGKVHPQAFRHTCATEKAVLGFSNSQMCAFFGWSQASKMPAVYIHMTGKGVKEAYQRALGLPADGKPQVRVCPRCGYVNSFRASVCGRCYTILDVKTQFEVGVKAQELQKKVAVLSEALEDISVDELINKLKGV